MSDSNSGSGFFVGFIMGAAVGAILGLLYAPRPGRETRDLIRDRFEDVKLKAVDVVDGVRDEAGVVKDKAKSVLEGHKPPAHKGAES
jgi:gas vesicle protein